MIRRILVLDLILVAVLAIGARSLRLQWLQYNDSHQVSLVQPKPESIPSLPSAPSVARTSTTDWTDIPSKNLFSFDRTDIAIVIPPDTLKPAGPKPMLFGTIKLGQDHLAMVGSGQSNNRSDRPMRIGETIDGWTLVDIQEKSIVVSWNDTKQTIVMSDPTAQVPRDYSRTASPGSASTTVLTSTPAPTTTATPATTAPAAPGSQALPKTHVIDTPFGKKVIVDPQ